jgi:hypothetical protein
MRCSFIAPNIIACGSRPARKRCSTPGCRRAADLACDYPIIRARSLEPTPKRGDARLHRQHRVLFFVWSVSLEGSGSVSICQQDPNTELRPGKLQDASFEDWFAKTDPTCDRPVCSRCTVNGGGGLDFCGAHVRARPAAMGGT